MSRVIKFRFWDMDLKKMCFRHPAKMDFSHPKIIPMQFTGLTDKNGKDIYEGDICTLEINHEGTQYHEGNDAIHRMDTGIVTYMPSMGYYLKVFKSWDLANEAPTIHPKVKSIVQYRTEVIGNIHEHKHLLK